GSSNLADIISGGVIARDSPVISWGEKRNISFLVSIVIFSFLGDAFGISGEMLLTSENDFSGAVLTGRRDTSTGLISFMETGSMREKKEIPPMCINKLMINVFSKRLFFHTIVLKFYVFTLTVQVLSL
ncbi:MAG TPA: hypothetical protein PLE69_05360, partial [bacterium]|nr:hypothetical protein [bacterium]